MTANSRILEEPAPALTLGRDRDASPTIRGFVYQVDLTIDRWLDLGAEDILELERGEDIDRVSRAVTALGAADWDRLMEQVKHRDTPVTLRSTSIRSALANFFEHHGLNPGRRIRFRFTTNAASGKERPSPLSGGERGIDVWQRLAGSSEQISQDTSPIDGVRELLIAERKPDDVTDASWDTWQKFVREIPAQEFLQFVRSVEIATRMGDAASLRSTLEERLHREGYAQDAEHASHLYRTLFAAVFAKLSARGLKRLTRADLEAEIAGTGPGSTDRTLLAKLDAFRAFIEERLGRVEAGLEDVRAEVGGMRTEVSTLATTVGLARAPLGALPGDTRTFQLTANYFGAELDATSTFNHARGVVGRVEVINSAVSIAKSALTSGSGILVIGGIGGVGKSRVLIALAGQLERDGVAVRWLRDHTAPSIDSLNELPAGPVSLFCDDAHRRSDLDQLLSLSESRNDPTLIVLGTRPRGRDALRVAAFHSGIGWDRVHDLGDLKELERDDLLALVRSELGQEDQRWAEAVVQITHGSTLVALVAARLLRTRRLNPGILSQDQEAHDLIFAAFEDEIYGRVSNDIDAELAKRTLELLAAIGPVSMKDDNLVSRAADYLRTDDATLRRVIGVLQEAGVLREQRRGVRIIPDVLSDHVLHRMLVAGGRATRAERVILESLGNDVLPDVLRNVGELDWQMHTAPESSGAAEDIDIFSDVWERFVDTFRAASNQDRAAYLEQLRPVAGFQPAPVLALCEWTIANPAGDEPTDWGVPFTSANALAKVTSLLATVAEHEEHFDRAVDLLWELGRDDRRQLNRFSDHAIRVLHEVVAYGPQRYVWRQERAIAALRKWTRVRGWSESAHTPLGVAQAALGTAMVEDRYDPRTSMINMTRYGVNAEVTRLPREESIKLLTDLALDVEPRGRVSAVEVLISALRPPDSQFGHVVTDEEEDGFRLQYDAAFDGIERIARESQDPLVRVKLRDALHWVYRRTRLKWKRDRARELIGQFPENEQTRLVRVWGRTFHDAFGELDDARQPFERVREFGETLTNEVAASLLAEEGSLQGIVSRLVAERARFLAADVHGEPGFLLAAIAGIRPETAIDLADWMLSSEAGTSGADFAPWLPVLLMVIRPSHAERYLALLQRAVSSLRPDLRWSAASTLLRVTMPPWNETERGHASTLLRDPDPRVRATTIEAIGRVPVEQRTEFISSIEIGGDQSVAKTVAELWAYRSAEDQVRLSEPEAKRILDALADFPELGDPQAEFDQMLAVFTKWYPLLVLDFVLERARRETQSLSRLGEAGYTRYEAVPYTDFNGVWSALQGASEYPAIVRRVLAAFAQERPADSLGLDHGTMDVVRRIILWDNEVERTIREWMDERRCDEVARLDVIIGEQATLFILEHRAFVIDLLEWAGSCDAANRKQIEDALFASTTRTIRARRRGEVDTIDVRLRDEGRSLANELSLANRNAAAEFFEDIANRAERRLASATERDDRSIAEQREWEDDE